MKDVAGQRACTSHLFRNPDFSIQRTHSMRQTDVPVGYVISRQFMTMTKSRRARLCHSVIIIIIKDQQARALYWYHL
jgi:hypothetical protein